VTKIKAAISEANGNKSVNVGGNPADEALLVKSYAQAEVGKQLKIKTTIDIEYLELFRHEDEETYEELVDEAFEKAALPEFCWLHGDATPKCANEQVTNIWKDLDGNKPSVTRTVKMERNFLGDCVETCYDGNTNLRFPKCKVILGIVYWAYCN